MSDLSEGKSPGYCRSKNALRTVATTKWELPIPGSKPYWDKICDDLEQRKEHVSDSSCPPSPSPDLITDSDMIINGRESTLSKSNYVVEPIVKIFPPTPMRMMPLSRRLTTSDDLTAIKNDAERGDYEKDSINSNLSDDFSPVNVIGKKDAKLYEISICMKEILKSNTVQTKKSCQLHKNTPPLKIFDDNLKRFLPKKKLKLKLPSTKKQPRFPPTVPDLSKLHRNKCCPFRSQPVFEDRVEFGVDSTNNKNRISPSLKRSKTEGTRKIKLDPTLKVPDSPYVSLRSNLKYQRATEKSKSKTLISNLNHMLSIPKLTDISVDENFMFNEEAMADLDFQQQFQALPEEHRTQVNFSHSRKFDASELETLNLNSAGSNEKLAECSFNENVIPKLSKNFKPTSSHSMSLPRLSDRISTAPDEEMKRNELGVSKSSIRTGNLRGYPEKDFLKVPKLGATSSYPSFSKLTPGDSVEADESPKPVAQRLASILVSQNVDNTAQQMESSSVRDLLKVPKLSMMSSYPSFNSLIPESLDSDDNTTGASDLLSKRMSHEISSNISVSSIVKSTQAASIFGDKLTSSNDEKLANYSGTSDPKTTRNKEISPTITSSQTKNPKRRHSLKDSVRYAYRALKFMTPNKNLNFQPQSFRPTQKSGSSAESSDSSRDSKFSKFEPVIKLLTYEDISKDRPPIRSVSSSTYGTVRSRLRQSASQHLGSSYTFSRLKAATPSTTIPSLTRSTSGPTLDFQEPVLKRPSDKILSKLPKMSIFPRRKYDKCFACLHKAFEEPVMPKRELPLATLNAVVKETIRTFSESESSSISLPDVKEFVESQSDYEDNWTELVKSTKKSALLDKVEWRSSKGSFRANPDAHKSRQTLVRASEESQSLKSDVRMENLRKNLSSKDSMATNTHSKPMSLSSEHSKPSSMSGHSSESEEPQVQVKKEVPTSECFVSPYAPLYWAPSLDPLKSLKLRKPVSMHGRAISITKTEGDSTSDDDAHDYRSTRKETKVNSTPARKVEDNDQNITNLDSSSKSGITVQGEKPNLVKQPSVVAKIVTSQISTVANLSKKRSRVDLLSGDAKSKDQTSSSADGGEEILKETSNELQQVEVSSQHERPLMPESDHERRVEPKSTEISLTKSSLPLIAEQSNENESLLEKCENDKSVLSRTDITDKFREHELSAEKSGDHAEETCKIYSNERVIEILEKCVEENRTPFEMLEALNAVATQTDPFTNKETTSNPEIARCAKIATNLIKLLIDSKKYLNPDTFSPNLLFSSPQTPLCNPRQLRRVLPARTYNLVARILGMPENPVGKTVDQKPDFESGHQVEDPFKIRQNRHRGPIADSCDMIVHPPSARGGRRPIIDADDFEYPKQSPYALFMNKPRRKAIKWRPLTERDMLGYDPEATLNMRATRVTNKICKDFCQWLRGLGGGHSEDIDEEVLKDMFQIEFTAEACRTMQVLIKEIPMVPIAVALARNTPGAGELALTRRHLIRDAKAEKMPKKIIGFGSMLPQAQRFVPPKNRVEEKWLQCKNVPQDLETMETVWKGITHLDSVKGFLAWVKAHPGVKPPKILTEAYGRKEGLLGQPSAEEANGHIELEMDQIESLKVGDTE